MGETHVAVGELAYSIDSLNVIKVEEAELHSFEYSKWINIGSQRTRLVIIYRPPYSAAHPVTVSTFLCEFANLLESLILSIEPQGARRTLCYGLLLYIFFKNFKICAKMYILIKFTCLVCSLSISRLFTLSRLAVLMSTQCRPFST